MFFSIVIPLFNKEKYVLRAVNSVLNQTHSNFELIIVDDGSTDNSFNVVKAISDPRICLFHQGNGGVSRARNAGINAARGDWIAFLDADDEYLPDFLSQMSAFIKEHDAYNLSFVGANYYIGSKSRIAMNDIRKNGIYDYFKLFENQRSPNNSSTTVVKKNKIMEVDGFPEGVRQFEDWAAWFKLAFVGDFGFVSTPLGIYHHVTNSAGGAKRPPIDLFNDAKVLPKIIDEFLIKYPLSIEKQKLALGCLNEFSINMAGYLAHSGSKALSLHMLKFLHTSGFTVGRFGRLRFLLIHLLVPQCIKRLYWHYLKKY